MKNRNQRPRKPMWRRPSQLFAVLLFGRPITTADLDRIIPNPLREEAP